MTDRPLGIADLLHRPASYPERTQVLDHWTWCRRHERAEHTSWPDKDGHTAAWGGLLVGDCIRIGPFMSAGEASRLGEGRVQFTDHLGEWQPALGMVIGE